MIDFKYKDWNSVPISVFNEIKGIAQDEGMPDTDKTIEILGILTDTDIDTLYSQPISVISDLTDRMSWINDFNFNKKWSGNKIKLNNITYDVQVDLNKFTYAQYVDFNMLWKGNYEENLSQLLTIFIIPKGMKYNDGYDMAELQRTIENNMSITMSQSLLFFFVKTLSSSINYLRTYLVCQLKMMKMKNWVMRKETDREQERLMKQAIAQIAEMQSLLGWE